MPRSASPAQGGRLRSRPHPRLCLARACHAQPRRFGNVQRPSSSMCMSPKSTTRRRARRSAQSRLHGRARGRRSDGECACAGVEGRNGHLRGQNQQERAAGCMRVSGMGSAWEKASTETGGIPSRISTLPRFSRLSLYFFSSLFLTDSDQHARQQCQRFHEDADGFDKGDNPAHLPNVMPHASQTRCEALGARAACPHQPWERQRVVPRRGERSIAGTGKVRCACTVPPPT